VVAILDSNVSPDGIAFPVPANDDASRAIRLYCEAIAIAATRGGNEQVARRGVDVGAMDAPPVEEALTVEPAPAAAEPVETIDFTPAPEAAPAADEAVASEAAAEEERQLDA
jgi:small subunit ribosomal protein S2